MKKVYLGVDIGSTTTKAVGIDEAGNILGFSLIDTQYDRNESGNTVVSKLMSEAGISEEDIAGICATGYGRKVFEKADMDMPEIMCHGRGTVYLHPETRTIIDVGGQDSKIISVDETGFVQKFEMNDKCAAGTGRFFEVLSHRLLNVTMDQLGDLALRSESPCQISSTCTVFAESEIVSLLSQGASVADISAGILESIARRMYSMGFQGMITMKNDVVASGGLARNKALCKALSEKFKINVITIPNPQMPAALGAALIAKDKIKS